MASKKRAGIGIDSTLASLHVERVGKSLDALEESRQEQCSQFDLYMKGHLSWIKDYQLEFSSFVFLSYLLSLCFLIPLSFLTLYYCSCSFPSLTSSTDPLGQFPKPKNENPDKGEI